MELSRSLQTHAEDEETKNSAPDIDFFRNLVTGMNQAADWCFQRVFLAQVANSWMAPWIMSWSLPN